MGVSKNRGTPKSSILIGFSIVNHPFWGTSIFGNTHIYIYTLEVNHHFKNGGSFWKMIFTPTKIMVKLGFPNLLKKVAGWTSRVHI